MSSPDAGLRFAELLSIMTRLRGEGGCPWDRQQSRDSLRPFLVEETYEVLDALDAGQPERLREELGDLLFQVVFHAEIARERGEFAMVDVLDALARKMVRRHPHVFGDRSVATADEALAQWEAIKRAERADGRRSLLEGIPRTLPALLRAQRLQHRASRVGFDWPDWTGALAKTREELDEVAAALDTGEPVEVAREIGDLLFAAVNVARLAGVDPEGALDRAADRFSRRFARMETLAATGGRELEAMTAPELDALWGLVKSEERRP
jgi:tetrapyrrole methylase family protein/MazG family protein